MTQGRADDARARLATAVSVISRSLLFDEEISDDLEALVVLLDRIDDDIRAVDR